MQNYTIHNLKMNKNKEILQKIIKYVKDIADKNKIPYYVCGEIGRDF